MKIAVFGATGGTGNEIVKQALEAGHEVTAFVRDAARLSIQNEKLTVVMGDVFDADSVAKAVQGQDAVVCALGAGSDLKKTTVRTTGTVNMINVMQQANGTKQRLIVVTAMGTGESWDDMSLLNKFFYAVLLKNTREDHEAQEAAIKESGLDWTIIRPSGLSDKPLTGAYHVGQRVSAKTSEISRADVADLILNELEQKIWIGKAITITG